MLKPRTRNRFAVALILLIVAASGSAQAAKLDPTFSEDGKVTTQVGDRASQANAVTTDAQGRTVAAGYSAPEDSMGYIESAVAVTRYLRDGTLDPSFGGDGRITFGDDVENVAFDVAVDEQGRVVTAGYAGWFAGDSDTSVSMAVQRFLPDGTPDKSFGGDGEVMLGERPVDVACGLELDARGRMVVAGYGSSLAGGNTDMIIARLRTNGSLDRRFGGDGLTSLDFSRGKTSRSDDVARDVTLDGRQRVVVAGYTERLKDRYRTHGSRFTVTRLKTDGELDRSFGNGGKTAAFDRGISSAASVVADRRGIVAAGYRALGEKNRGDFAIARFTAKGRPDRGFGRRGSRIVDFGGAYESANALVAERRGRLTVAGYTGPGKGGRAGEASRWAVLGLTKAGRIDRSFSRNGKLSIYFGPGRREANGLAIQPGGFIVAAGDAAHGSRQRSSFGLARFRR